MPSSDSESEVAESPIDLDPVFPEDEFKIKRPREFMNDRLLEKESKIARREESSEVDDFFDWDSARLDTRKMRQSAGLSAELAEAVADIENVYCRLDSLAVTRGDLQRHYEDCSGSQKKAALAKLEACALECEDNKDKALELTERIAMLSGWTLSSRHVRSLAQTASEAQGFWDRLRQDADVYDTNLTDEEDEFYDRSKSAATVMVPVDHAAQLAEKIQSLEADLAAASPENKERVAAQLRRYKNLGHEDSQASLDSAQAAINAAIGRRRPAPHPTTSEQADRIRQGINNLAE